MISLDKVKAEAKKKENENFKFRTFLKCHADADELDSQFLRLHKELFADYDCSKCRNCCKMYKGSIPVEDIDRDAQYLEITPEQFIDTYLEKEEYGINYQTKHKPCDFCRKTVTVNWAIVNLIAAKNIHIPTSRRDCQACLVY